VPEPPDEASFEPEFTPSEADALDNLIVAHRLLANHIGTPWHKLDILPNEYEEMHPPDNEINESFRGELLDGAKMIDLFKDVVVFENEDGIGFTVPERLIKSEHHGIFGLEISGKLRHFKEHDDYGNVRTIQTDDRTGYQIWVPHLYPFEPVDPKTHLPEILDRERCLMEVRLRSLIEEQDVPHRCEIAIHTEQGIFAAPPAIDLSYGSGRNYYTEFHWFEHDAIAQQVEWPNVEAPSVTDFLGELMLIDPDRYERLMNGEEDTPHQFTYPHKPLDFRKRRPWENINKMQAFGEIWVPIEELRRGIDAKIEFPDFQA
jgi:hypothetical protein